jgi:hypothetical protein
VVHRIHVDADAPSGKPPPVDVVRRRRHPHPVLAPGAAGEGFGGCRRVPPARRPLPCWTKAAAGLARRRAASAATTNQAMKACVHKHAAARATTTATSTARPTSGAPGCPSLDAGSACSSPAAEPARPRLLPRCCAQETSPHMQDAHDEATNSRTSTSNATTPSQLWHHLEYISC